MRRFSAVTATSLLVLLAVPTVGHAEGAASVSIANDAPVPGEIVVTAQKREQNVQKVGIAITAIGKEEMRAIGRQDVTALEGQVPNLSVNQYSPTITQFNIRGVSQNDFTDAQEAPIAFYDDEVYVASLGAISGMNFDLDRVEVLRGPQGTLFGRNATGGLVQFISAKPTRKEEGYLTVTGGSYGQVATEGAISGPLSENVRARLSFTTNNAGGYIKNTLGPSIGNSKFYAGRLQIAADLTPRDKLSFKAQVLRNDDERNGGTYAWVATYPNALGLGDYAANLTGGNPSGAAQGADANGYISANRDPFVQSFNRTPFFARTFWEATARYEHDFGNMTLTSISDYQNLKKDYREDSDMSPLTVFDYDTHQRLYQVSEELRLAGKTDKLNWVLGVYGLNIHTNNQYQVNNPGTTFPGIGLLNYGGSLDTKTIAGFGQIEYAVTPQISVTGGLRYSYDRKHNEFQDYWSDGTVPSTLVFDWATSFPTVANLRFENFGNWSGKAEIEYKPDNNTLIYASVNRGTKSGGFGTISSPGFAGYTIDPAVAAAAGGPPLVQAIPFGQEVLINYEGGFKLTLFNRTTHLNGSAFFYNYDGYQAFQNVGTNQYITNHKAYNKGVELEFNTRPVKGLYLSAFLTFLDSKVKGITLPSGVVADRQLPQAPKASAGWLVRYEFPAGPGMVALQTDWKYESGQYFETINAPVDYEPGHTVGNVRISYKFGHGKYELAAFANNVTDKWYRVYNLDLSGLLGSSNQTYGRPRWMGGSLTVNF